MSIISISLPEEIVEELDNFSKKTGRGISEIVKEALSIYLWETKLKEIQKTLAPQAKELGIITEEDVFEVIS